MSSWAIFPLLVDQLMHSLVSQLVGPRVPHNPLRLEAFLNAFSDREVAFNPPRFYDPVMVLPETSVLFFPSLSLDISCRRDLPEAALSETAKDMGPLFAPIQARCMATCSAAPEEIL